MAINIGLRYALTFCGMVDFIVPCILKQRTDPGRMLIIGHYTSLTIRIAFTWRNRGFLLRRLRQRMIDTICPPKRPLLELPYEVREQIYRDVCEPDYEGKVDGALNLLLINEQIQKEAKPIFDQIPHTIRIGELNAFQSDTPDFMGFPRLITLDDQFEWHLASLQNLILVVSAIGISTMTPDCFDVLIPLHSREQWRNIKRLIGIWPEIRDTPLDSIRLDFQPSKCEAYVKTYRADIIRVIRNFKRTKVWAETLDGDCSHNRSTKSARNTSKLLPLVRAFNQGRRNWVTESHEGSNILVHYDKQILSKTFIQNDSEDIDVCELTKQRKAQDRYEVDKKKWSVIPTDDTSRSESNKVERWTHVEANYVQSKMMKRTREDEREFECRECLAVFETLGELREHRGRGRTRAERFA